MMKQNLIALALVLAMAVLAAPVMAGLTVDPADPDYLNITEMDGSVSYNFTITDVLIAQDGTIDIDVSSLDGFVADTVSVMTNDNVVVSDTAIAADWTYNIAASTLTLTSTGGDTAVGETVNVTFTGAGGNPWYFESSQAPFPLVATRMDADGGTATFDFSIETVPGHLGVTTGEKITSTDGATWANFTITDAPIIKDYNITIPVTGLFTYVASGTFTTANVVVEDSVADPTVWTGTVTGNTLTLNSTGGRTPVGSWVNVSFTGATNPWIPNSTGTKTVSLTGTRFDSAQTGTFNFVIRTVPPAGYAVAADFTASRTADIAPLTVVFTDKSGGNPDMWNWSFGDSAWFNTTTPASKSPTHTYTNVGKYTVNLTAKNVYGPDKKTRDKYISVLNGTVVTANTTITGLTTTTIGGQQSVAVDTTVLTKSALIPNNSVLEIQPPADRGLKNITIYAMPGVFVPAGGTISGPVSGVHLVSAEIAPSSPPFSLATGPKSSFNYSIDLATYPSNGLLTTKIWEGVIDEYDAKFRKVVDGNGGSGVAGTAYTANIEKTNIPSGTAVKIYMSVNSSWSQSLVDPTGMIFIVRISDDSTEGQVLPTQFLYNDPAEKLDYYEADSTRGLSTFGLYSLTGPNNPFQLVALAIANAPSNQPSSDSDSGTGNTPGAGTGQSTGPASVVEPGVQGAPASPAASEPVTAELSVTDQGVVTEATELQSADGIATVSIDQGVVALDQAGAPVSSVSIDTLAPSDMPSVPQDNTVSFAGIAYELGPNGAQFSPAISITFAVPAGQVGQDLTVRTYDHATDTWQDLPTTFDPVTGMVTAEVSHFCCFALFTKFVTAAPTLAATPAMPAMTPQIPTTLKPPSPTIATTFLGIILMVVNLLVTNPVLLVGIAVLAVGIVLMVWKQRRDRLYPKP